LLSTWTFLCAMAVEDFRSVLIWVIFKLAVTRPCYNHENGNVSSFSGTSKYMLPRLETSSVLYSHAPQSSWWCGNEIA
jgi:hypothetical protein